MAGDFVCSVVAAMGADEEVRRDEETEIEYEKISSVVLGCRDVSSIWNRSSFV